MTGNYDKDTKTIYWGVGNAAPWPGDGHPGDNLYTSSVLGLDPDTGKIKAFHQYHQNNSWDWDEVDAPMLVDLKRDGRTFKSLIHPGRDAIFWVLERKPDSINYVAGWPFVKTNVWKGIEAETGRPIVDPEHKPIMGKRVEFCPSLWGGKDWPSAAYSQKTGLVYVPANENFCGGFTGEKVPLVPGQLWLGTKPEDIGLTVVPGADHYGELQAWDPATGKKVWSHNFPKSQLFGSVTATAGDLIFAGGTNDRMFRAFDAKTGEVLWEQKTNSGIMGMPMAYEVDGTEYIAIQSGWGVDAQRIQDALAGNHIGTREQRAARRRGLGVRRQEVIAMQGNKSNLAAPREWPGYISKIRVISKRSSRFQNQVASRTRLTSTKEVSSRRRSLRNQDPGLFRISLPDGSISTRSGRWRRAAGKYVLALAEAGSQLKRARNIMIKVKINGQEQSWDGDPHAFAALVPA